uniref:Uncharacterized protein n=1 Tax=Cacopsylla melanoneura TaxID=428564 RepID=A0A8D8RE13_9HEMI
MLLNVSIVNFPAYCFWGKCSAIFYSNYSCLVLWTSALDSWVSFYCCSGPVICFIYSSCYKVPPSLLFEPLSPVPNLQEFWDWVLVECIFLRALNERFRSLRILSWKNLRECN